MAVKLSVAIRVPEEAPREFDLFFDKSVITLGRDRENDVQIPLGTVSRRHTKIYETNGDWFIQDLHSTHGTKVNDNLLGLDESKLLKEGDIIQIVYAYITFHEAESILSETGTNEEKTSVVAQKLVKDVVNNLDEATDLPHLVIMNGSLQGQTINLKPNQNELILGRGDNCDVRLDDVNTSRRHAMVTRDHNDFFIEDLGSKNGVTVDGRKIQGKTLIRDGDEIYLGATHISFINPEESILNKLGELPAFSKPAFNADKKEVETENAATKGTPENSVISSAPVTNSTLKTNSEVVTKSKTVAAQRRFGGVEYVLLALLGLVMVGLIVGVVVALT